MKVCAPDLRAASTSSASVAPGFPYRIFSATVPANRNTSCWTMPIAPRSEASRTSRTSTPSMRTLPDSTS